MQFRTFNRFLSFAVTLAICLLSLPLTKGAESTGTIATGTKWETPYYIIDSGIDGPKVVITGGVHGNEPAGYRAAEQIRHWPIARGKLIVLPKVNIPGLKANTRYMPEVPDAQKDLNRDFLIGDQSKLTTEGTLATELWNFVSKQEPNWVIDLHEGYEFHTSHVPPKGEKPSVGSTIIYRASELLDPLVTRALAAANAHVTDPKRKFVPLKRGPVSGSFAHAAARKLGAQSMILETTFKDQPLSLRTRQHRAMVNSLLNDIGLINRDCSNLLSKAATAAPIQVGIFDGPGTGDGGKNNIPRIADEAQIEIHFLGAAEMQPDVLTQFDLLIFPGGSGSVQANALGNERREHIRNFVQSGGGYIGVCAGAYLCSAHYTWSLALVDSSVFTGSREIEGVGRKSMWYRGEKTRVELELSEAGKKIFTRVPPKFDVVYHNGPIISPKNLPDLEDYTPLAWFRTEQVLYAPQKGTMLDTPAIVSGRFGQGRVLSISPHPESDKSLESLIIDSIHWSAKHPSPRRP